MDISVIVPIYGVEKYIDKSLRSLFSQTKTEGVEFILVNDCTKDKSMEVAQSIIEDFPNLDIKVIHHEKNCGVAATRQTAMDAAIGEYTIHFDPDDWCETNMLEELYNTAKESDTDIVVCDYYVNYSNRQKYVEQQILKDGIENVKLLLIGKLHGSLCNKLIKTTLYTDNNITLIPKLDMGEDFVLCTKLFSVTNKISYLPKAYLYYMQNNSSMTFKLSKRSLLNLINGILEIEMFFKKCNLYSEINHSLISKKLEYKAMILRGCDGLEQKKYAMLYPETNNFIWSNSALSKLHKAALFFAVKKHLFLSNFIYMLLNIGKKIKRKFAC